MKAEEFDLKIVVNGQPTTVRVKTREPLRSLIQPALDQTGVVGRPIEDWELRDRSGVLLSHNWIVEKPFADDTLLFLTLKVGWGAAQAVGL